MPLGDSENQSFLIVENRKVDTETGSVDSFLMLMPIILLSIMLFGLFQYGLVVNTLTNDAILIGRQLARSASGDNLESSAKRTILAQKLEVSDVHLMRFNLGNRVFLQLILVGRTFAIGPFQMTPSGKSITPVDFWE